ncbi:vacuolar protein sorting-associated protein 33A-like [Paramacrobiotus metropolitanus]|uniref:vacuolar protein sorting-associated protein 33A-like n=1 Tax=Paramacrobiotus metropolitanus TaxID=2943436 RepID=UPI00244592E2|nr:vacuolar protein sorting-associated protein 33A-like [Paramacrobiotus metropolitanus]
MVIPEKNSINFLSFKDRARRELLNCLDECPGTKAVVWDEYLIGPFSLLSDYAGLQERQVKRMFTLKSDFPKNVDFANMFFLVRSELRVMKDLARFLSKISGASRASAGFPKLYVYFVPSNSSVCQKALVEMCPHAGSLIEAFRECAVMAFPLETDLLSLELETSFKDLFLDEDPTPLHHLAGAVNLVQQVYGVIPNIYAKGKYAKQLVDMIGKMGVDNANSEWNIPSRFDNLFLIDRNVDLLTLMPIQLTYEGLIDECFGITQGTAKLPADKFPITGQSSKTAESGESSKAEPKEKKITLNSTDELYAEIRDKNFSAVGPIFSSKTKFLSAKMGERFSAKEVAEMKDFVAKMPHLLALKQSLTTFMSIAEIIKPLVNNDDFLDSLEVQQKFLAGLETDKVHPYIEQLIARCEPFEKVVRLICLQSEVNGGLKPAVLTAYKRDIIHTYGFQEIVTLRNFEKAGLFRVPAKSWHRVVKEKLKLVVESSDSNMRDISYVYSGYAPLSVRLARYLVHPGWKSISDTLDLLPGERLEAKQKVPDHLRKRRNSITSSMSTTDEPPVVTLVVFIGGVTYSEVSALRFLSNQEDSSTVFHVLTTQMVNGSSVVESLKETLTPTILPV